MANELKLYALSRGAAYARVMNAAGSVVATVALTQSDGAWTGSMPAGLDAATFFNVVYCQQVGSQPDAADPAVGQETLTGDGRPAIEAIAARIASGSTSPTTTTPTSNTITIVAGNDYLAADGRALTWTTSGPSLSGGAASFVISQANSDIVITTVAAQIVSANSVRVELTKTDTNLPVPNGRSARYRWSLTGTLADGSVVTLGAGPLIVLAA